MVFIWYVVVLHDTILYSMMMVWYGGWDGVGLGGNGKIWHVMVPDVPGSVICYGMFLRGMVRCSPCFPVVYCHLSSDFFVFCLLVYVLVRLPNCLVCTVCLPASLSRSLCSCLFASHQPVRFLQTIQQVLINLRIAHIECRSEDDPEVARHTHARQIEVSSSPLLRPSRKMDECDIEECWRTG